MAYTFEKTYELSDFSKGMSFGYPSGAANSLALKRGTQGYLITPEGGISTAIGYQAALPLAKEASTKVFENLRQIYWWERTAGGGVLLIVTAPAGSGVKAHGSIYYPTTRGPKWDPKRIRAQAAVWRNQMAFEWTVAYDDSLGLCTLLKVEEADATDFPLRIECRDKAAFIDFVPYGDYCFVFDGVNMPIRLNPDLTISNAACPIVGGCILARAVGGGPSDAMRAGAYTYAFLPVMGRLGEGVVGYAEDSGDESFLSVSIPTELLGSSGGPFHIGSMEWSDDYWKFVVSNLGLSDSEAFGGNILLSNFSSYFEGVAGVTAVKIYRTRVNAGGEYYYVGTVFDGEDTFLDSVPDKMIGTALDIGLKRVSRARVAATYHDRLWTVGDMDAGFPNLIRFSEKHHPMRFPESYFLYEPHIFKDDYVTRITAVKDHLYLFTKKAIFEVVGEAPSDYDLRVVSSAVGCIAPKSMVAWKEGVIFLSSSGPFYFDGASVVSLGGGMQAYFDQRHLAGLDDSYVAAAASDTYYHICMNDDYLAVPEGSLTKHSYPVQTLSLCLATGGWSQSKTTSFECACSSKDARVFVGRPAAQYEENGGVFELVEDSSWAWKVLGLNAVNGLVNLDAGYGEHLPHIDFERLDFGTPDQYKTLTKVVVIYTGYIEEMWTLEISSYEMDEESDSQTIGPTSPPGWYSGPSIRWGEDTVGTAPTLKRKEFTQEFYVEKANSAYGKSFTLSLSPQFESGMATEYPVMWAKISRIRFHFLEEDVR